MDYNAYRKKVLSELDTALTAIDADQAERFAEMLIASRRVFIVGVGRVKLSLLAFVKRLNHLGITTTYVGAIDEPAIGREDLLVVGSGSGETAVPVAIAGIAKKIGARIVHIGSNKNSTVSALADFIIRIPCRTKLALPDEINSAQPMSSLFEQSLFLFLDIVALMIIEKKNIKWEDLWQTHANLE